MHENHQVDARAAIRTRLTSQPTVKNGKFGPGPDDSVTANAIRARLAAQPTVKNGKFGPGPEE
jgi:hypothetical protein